MKNILIALLGIVLMLLFSCKKDPLPDATTTQWATFLEGKTLPNTDTSSLGIFIEGYIDGQRFCLSEDKAGIFVMDNGSPIFSAMFDTSILKADSYGVTWQISQPESFKDKYFNIAFSFPNFNLRHDGTDSVRLRRYEENCLRSGTNVIGDKHKDNQYELSFNHVKDVAVAPGVTSSVGTSFNTYNCEQVNSFMRLVSVRKLGNNIDIRYAAKRELIYEFECNMGDSNVIVKRITKGRIRVYVY